MKKIIALLLAVTTVFTMAFALTSCNQDKSDLERIKENDKIVVGVTVYPPMDYVNDETGEWDGFDAVLAKLFAEKLGVNCQIVIINWSTKVAELDSYQIDLIWNGMTASDELGQKIDFSTKYAKNAQVAVVKTGSAVTADTVKDAKVAVENGSAGQSVAEEFVAEANLNKVTAQIDALNEVKAGQSQVAIIDVTMAESIVGKGEYADLTILEGATYGEELFAVGLRKGSDIKAELDAFLAELYADGTLAELAAEYGVSINNAAFAT